MIQITARDIELMSWILEQKFMDAGQIRRVFWKGSNEASKEVYRRLGELEKEGFVRRSQRDIYRYVLYLVSRKGLRLLRSYGRDQSLTVLEDVDYSEYRHDSEVTDLRIWFHERGVTGWVSERILTKFFELKHLPDALIYREGKYLAIEYETTQKSRQRYLNIFYEYEFDEVISEVLYIVNQPHLAEKLKTILPHCDKIRFLTLETLKACQNPEKLPGTTFFL